MLLTSMDGLGVVVFIMFLMIILGVSFAISLVTTGIMALVKSDNTTGKTVMKKGLKIWGILFLAGFLVLIIVSIADGWW